MDLFGPATQGFYLNQEQNQMLANVGFTQNNRKAILYLISQRNIPDQVRRPYNYRFGGDFRNLLNDKMLEAQQRSGNIKYLNNFGGSIMQDPIANGAILPPVTGDICNLRGFCDLWTFILILDNDNRRSDVGMVNSVPSRLLYSGWVMDEPVTPTNFGAGYTPNPTAIFNTTHHITLSAQMAYGPTSQQSYIETTGDFDYVDGSVAQSLSLTPTTLFDASPDKLMGSVGSESGAFNEAFQFSPVPLTATRRSLEIPTEYNSPAFHLQHIVNGFGSAVRMMQTEQRPVDNIIFSQEDALLSNVVTALQPHHNTVFNDLDPSRPFPFSSLIQAYGNTMDLHIITVPRESQVDLTDPAMATKRNVLTSIINNSLPGLLAQFGLAEIAFRYNAYERVEGGLGSTNGERGVFRLINAATLYPTTNEGLSLAVENFQQYLKMTVFPIILNNGGFFDLTCHCSLSGVCLTDLQLLDEMKAFGMTECNNLLGGLNSPVLAQFNTCRENANQMMSVVNDLRASTGTPGEMWGSVGFGTNVDIF